MTHDTFILMMMTMSPETRPTTGRLRFSKRFLASCSHFHSFIQKVKGRLKVGTQIWMFPKIGIPQNGWLVMENPIKLDDVGGNPLFLETPMLPGKQRFLVKNFNPNIWQKKICWELPWKYRKNNTLYPNGQTSKDSFIHETKAQLWIRPF